jgi:hypothetical protein
MLPGLERAGISKFLPELPPLLRAHFFYLPTIIDQISISCKYWLAQMRFKPLKLFISYQSTEFLIERRSKRR